MPETGTSTSSSFKSPKKTYLQIWRTENAGLNKPVGDFMQKRLTAVHKLSLNIDRFCRSEAKRALWKVARGLCTCMNQEDTQVLFAKYESTWNQLGAQMERISASQEDLDLSLVETEDDIRSFLRS